MSSYMNRPVQYESWFQLGFRFSVKARQTPGIATWSFMGSFMSGYRCPKLKVLV